MLDQVVVGISWKRQRIQPERIHRWQSQEPQSRVRGPQMRQIEGNQVVAQNEVRAVCKIVQPGQSRSQGAARGEEDQGLAVIGADPRESVDTAVANADFKV